MMAESNIPELLKKSNGQSLVEFVLLFVTVVSLSTIFLLQTNKRVAKIWKSAVELVVSPNPDPLDFK